MSIKIKVATPDGSFILDTQMSENYWDQMCDQEKKSYFKSAMKYLDITISAVDDDGEMIDTFEVR